MKISVLLLLTSCMHKFPEEVTQPTLLFPNIEISILERVIQNSIIQIADYVNYYGLPTNCDYDRCIQSEDILLKKTNNQLYISVTTNDDKDFTLSLANYQEIFSPGNTLGIDMDDSYYIISLKSIKTINEMELILYGLKPVFNLIYY